MEKQAIAAWLKLVGVELRSSRKYALLNEYGSPQAVLDAPSEDLAQMGFSPSEINRLHNAPEFPASAINIIESGQLSMVTILDDDYPANLKPLDGAPIALFIRGQLSETDRFSIGIVGTRKASSVGLMIAEQLAKDLAKSGLCIVSGGAFGIDTSAHQGALAAGGRTIAVLASGAEMDSPPSNRALFQKIAANGAVVSEFPPGTTPLPGRFPVRNWTLSGLSLGVIMVEVPERSGALITAGCAAEQGRDVFVVPGRMGETNYDGSHSLTKDGATLISSADDILAALGIPKDDHPKTNKPNTNLTPQQKRILEALSLEPTHPDTIARQLNLPTQALATELTILEITNQARRLPGGLYIRAL
ncbi:MAG: DNA-processing protein DprA [bacterium]